MVKMMMTDESWYVVRNTRGVTGFVRPRLQARSADRGGGARMGVENVPIKRISVGDREV